MKERIIETFDQLSSAYEKTVDHESLFNREYERPAMLSELPSSLVNARILDAGCAAGWYTEQLIGRGAKVVASDISPEMVSATQRRVGKQAEVIRLDLEEKMPFADNSFDYIVSSLTLHYLKDWNQPFQEFKRMLKPNGILLFSVHHPFTDESLTYQYFSTELIIDTWNKNGTTFKVPFYRRPLQYIINITANYFSIDKIIEPKPTEQIKEIALEKYEKLLKQPQLLIIKSEKNT